MAMQVHHGEDQHFTFFDGVNNAVGKAMSAAATDFVVQRLPSVWVRQDAPDGNANFDNEIETKTGNTLLVIPGRFPQFARGGRRQFELYRPNSASMERIASSPSVAWRSPSW